MQPDHVLLVTCCHPNNITIKVLLSLLMMCRLIERIDIAGEDYHGMIGKEEVRVDIHAEAYYPVLSSFPPKLVRTVLGGLSHARQNEAVDLQVALCGLAIYTKLPHCPPQYCIGLILD